jgi:hypothetical protein
MVGMLFDHMAILKKCAHGDYLKIAHGCITFTYDHHINGARGFKFVKLTHGSMYLYNHMTTTSLGAREFCKCLAPMVHMDPYDLDLGAILGFVWFKTVLVWLK